MHIIISGIVPYLVGAKLHGIRMLRRMKVIVGMSSHIPTAAYMATNQAYPEVFVRATLGACVVENKVGRLRVSTYWTACITPFGQTCRVKRVIA